MALHLTLNGEPVESRLSTDRRERTEVYEGARLYERVFCLNCGTPGGAVTKGSPVFFVCDGCVEKHGPPPGAIEVKL